MSRCQGYATNLGFSSKTAKLNIHKFTMMLRISLPLVLAVCHQIRLLQVLSAYSPLPKQPPVSIKKDFLIFESSDLHGFYESSKYNVRLIVNPNQMQQQVMYTFICIVL